MLVIFASNVKCSDTRNPLPIFRVLVIFAFSLKTRIMQKFPAHELLAFYSISFQCLVMVSGGEPFSLSNCLTANYIPASLFVHLPSMYLFLSVS